MSSTTPRNQTKKKGLFERFGITLPNIRSRFRRNQTVKVTAAQTAPQTAPQTVEEIELQDYKTLQKAGPKQVIDAFKFDIEKLKVQGESSEEFIEKLRQLSISINKEITRETDRTKIKQLQLSRRDIDKTIQDTQKLINQTNAARNRERMAVTRLETTQTQTNTKMKEATRKLKQAQEAERAYSERRFTGTRKKGKGGMKKRRKYKKRH